jgi:hypothetical protein
LALAAFEWVNGILDCRFSASLYDAQNSVFADAEVVGDLSVRAAFFPQKILKMCTPAKETPGRRCCS